MYVYKILAVECVIKQTMYASTKCHSVAQKTDSYSHHHENLHSHMDDPGYWTALSCAVCNQRGEGLMDCKDWPAYQSG